MLTFYAKKCLYGCKTMGLSMILILAFTLGVYAQITPDDYESDNEIQFSNLIEVGSTGQNHNFHEEGDVDWVKFYAFSKTPTGSDNPYNIEVVNMSTSCDVVIKLYKYTENGIEFEKKRNDKQNGENETLLWDACLEDDYYFIKVYALEGTCDYSSQGYTDYQLKVTTPSAPEGTGSVEGKVLVEGTSDIICDVLVTIDNANRSGETDADGVFRISNIEVPEGGQNFTLSFSHTNYDPPVDPVSITVERNEIRSAGEIFMPPTVCTPGDLNEDGQVDFTDFQLAFQYKFDVKRPEANVFCSANLNLCDKNDTQFLSPDDLKKIFDLIAEF